MEALEESLDTTPSLFNKEMIKTNVANAVVGTLATIAITALASTVVEVVKTRRKNAADEV